MIFCQIVGRDRDESLVREVLDWVVEVVHDTLNLSSSMVSELAHMLEKLFTHVLVLLEVAVGSYDIAPVVLKLEVPAFALFLVLMVFKGLLVSVVFYDFIVDLFNLVVC